MKKIMGDVLSGQRVAPQSTSFSKPFWDAAREGRLIYQVCRRTGRAQFFPRPVSVWTGSRDMEWRESSGKGSIYSFTVTHHAPPPYKVSDPYVVALVELDEGIRIISNIVNCDLEAVAIGARVRLLWSDAGSEKFPLFELDRGKK